MLLALGQEKSQAQDIPSAFDHEPFHCMLINISLHPPTYCVQLLFKSFQQCLYKTLVLQHVSQYHGNFRCSERYLEQLPLNVITGELGFDYFICIWEHLTPVIILLPSKDMPVE